MCAAVLDNRPSPVVLEPQPATQPPKRFLALSLLLSSIFLIPSIPLIGHPLRVPPLEGVAVPPKPSKPTLQRVLTQRFQREVEDFAARGTGLWPVLVRMANQITFSVFHQIGTTKNSSVLVGSDNALFQPMYLRSFNRSKPIDEKSARLSASNLHKLSKRLHKRGIPLVLLVSPNAIALYPELVPDAMVDPGRRSRPNSYEVGLPLFKRAGVPMVDMFDYFSKHRDDFPDRIFAPTGSHWNDYASCLATQRVLAKLTVESATPWSTISCEDRQWTFPPPVEDTDLLGIANILTPQRSMRPGVVVTHSSSTPPSPKRLLLVGTSFLFAVQSHLERAHAVSEAGLYFYSKSFRKTFHDRFHPLPLNRFNWADLSTYDGIVIEINQASLTGAGHGFVQAAIDALDKGLGAGKQ